MSAHAASTADKQRVPNRKALKMVRALGAITLLVGIGMGSYHFIHDNMLSLYGCVPASETLLKGDVRCSGLRWQQYVPLIICGALLASIAHMRYKHYYVKVYEGTVVGLDISGGKYNYFYVCLQGLTLAGEMRTYWVTVSFDTWRKLRDGDHFSWR